MEEVGGEVALAGVGEDGERDAGAPEPARHADRRRARRARGDADEQALVARERTCVRDRVVVGDGAIGTRIYEKGVPIGRCFDELNLTQPHLIKTVHQEYVEAGAELIETNTFTANRLWLQRFDLQGRVAEINRRGAELAREAGAQIVAGSVGPLAAGRTREEFDVTTRPAIFEEQMTGLLDGGVDALILETFTSIEELLVALSTARRLTKLPVIAQMTFLDGNRSPAGDGVAPFVRALDTAGADVIGVNCGVGPHWTVRAIEEVTPRTKRPVSAYSNAGKPDYVDGRFMYLSTPEYFAKTAQRLHKLGVNLIGGCCGTSPDDIRAIAEKVKGARPMPRPRESPPPPVEVAAAARPARKKPLRFWSALGKRKPIVVEIDPPRGLNVKPVIERARKLVDAGVDAITVGDNPLAVMRMGNMGFAHLLEREGVQTIAHLSCRDKNLLGLQSQLLEASALGIRSILAITGDPSKIGDQPRASSVYDLNSFELVRLIARMNAGLSHTGKSIQRKTDFRIGCAFNPNVRDVSHQIGRRRVRASAAELRDRAGQAGVRAVARGPRRFPRVLRDLPVRQRAQRGIPRERGAGDHGAAGVDRADFGRARGRAARRRDSDRVGAAGRGVRRGAGVLHHSAVRERGVDVADRGARAGEGALNRRTAGGFGRAGDLPGTCRGRAGLEPPPHFFLPFEHG